jgi:stearoyl-CoA desaturase (delta-9 desaturase)
VLRNEHRLGIRTVHRAAEQLAACFDSAQIALMIARARGKATETIASLHLPHMPTRAELLARAREMFAKTASLDLIVDRGRELLLASVSRHLAEPATVAR